MSASTPGPWVVVRVAQDDFCVCPAMRRGEIAFGIERPEDADLIGAAPDMLAALKFIFEHIADKERGPRDLYPAFGLNSSRAIEMARAAIAKAEGQTRQAAPPADDVPGYAQDGFRPEGR